MSSNPYIGARAGFDTERTIAAPFTGISQNVGTQLTHSPIIAIFDNQSDVSATLSINDVSWKTFVAGEALVLDLRANHGYAPTFVIDADTQFSLVGSGGTGQFSISLIYAR